MSTYFYLVCDDCMERTPAASRTLGGIGCHLHNSEFTLLPFIVKHGTGCSIRIISEYQPDAYSNKYTDWTKENYKNLAITPNANNPPTPSPTPSPGPEVEGP
jgi:hypothetical protein